MSNIGDKSGDQGSENKVFSGGWHRSYGSNKTYMTYFLVLRSESRNLQIKSPGLRRIDDRVNWMTEG